MKVTITVSVGGRKARWVFDDEELVETGDDDIIAAAGDQAADMAENLIEAFEAEDER